MREFLYQELDKDYTVALNTAPKIPAFLKSLGAKPMNLGLDLKRWRSLSNGSRSRRGCGCKS